MLNKCLYVGALLLRCLLHQAETGSAVIVLLNETLTWIH